MTATIEDYKKCVDMVEQVSCELCDLAGNLTILNDFLQECDPLERDKKEFYMVFRGIEQTISYTTETVKQLNDDMGNALNLIR